MTKKTLGIVLIIVVLIVAGVIALERFKHDAKPAVATEPPPVLSVNLTQAVPRNIPLSLSAYGSVAAWQEAVIGSEVNGLRLVEVRAQIGDTVRKGQVLAVFDDKTVLTQVAQSQASVTEAEANLSEARLKSRQAQLVAGSGALSELQVTEYATSEKSAQAKLQSAKAQLDAQQLQQRYTRVLASDDGIISARSATLGAVVNQGQELFRLIRQNRLEWRAELTSDELSLVKPGLTVTVAAAGLAPVSGKVRMLGPTVDSEGRKGLAYVDLPGAVAHGLRPGMFAKGELHLGFSTGLGVQEDALYVRDGFSYVFRVGEKSGDQVKVFQLKVQTGRHFEDWVEIVSGVNPADKLVARGVSFLTDGDSVRVVPK